MDASAGHRILETMLDRLLASLVSGPSLNARPHSSRQRLDLMSLSRLKDRPPNDVLRELLGEARKIRFAARVPQVARPSAAADAPPPSPEQQAAFRAYDEQQTVLTKLRGIAEDARDYENDTGVHILHIGFPLLSLPPGTLPVKGFARRVLAPLAFVPVNLSVKHGMSPSLALECRGEGADLVVPNVACLAWLSRLASVKYDDLDEDAQGARPWEEIAGLVARVCEMLRIGVPDLFRTGQTLCEELDLQPAPRSEDEGQEKPRIVPAAVLGLYPMSNQGLIRDTQALIDGERQSGPIQSFLKVDVTLDAAAEPQDAAASNSHLTRSFAQERLVAFADPCQARAVMLARTATGLVIHGPPGTGKSQTITNVIGDHLARGQRVLFVCDKRTALDLVMNRLQSLGLGDLCAIIHDPQRDQRELYRGIREQLEGLSNLRLDASAAAHLSRVDSELTTLHQELTSLYTGLMRQPDPAATSFHDLVGQWLAVGHCSLSIPRKLLGDTSLHHVEGVSHLMLAMLRRARECSYSSNPWRNAIGMELDSFLATPMSEVRDALSQVLEHASAVDAIALPPRLSYPPAMPLAQLARHREAVRDLAARVFANTNSATIARWLAFKPADIAQKRQELELIRQQTTLLASQPLDGELAASLGGSLPNTQIVQQQIADLERYLLTASSFMGVFAFSCKRTAQQILRAFGLPRNPSNARRVCDFLKAVRLRLALLDGFRLAASWETSAQPADAALLEQASALTDLLALRELLSLDAPATAAIRSAAQNPDTQPALLADLASTAQRAKALCDLIASAQSSQLLADGYIQQMEHSGREGKLLHDNLATLQQQLPHLEGVLRTTHDLRRLPESLLAVSQWLLTQDGPPEDALQALKREAIGLQISSRLKTSPQLQGFDRSGLEAMLQRYVELEAQKRDLVRAAIVHTWGERQKQRLLASTQTRLNSAGADLRRRLTIRGDNAMRLRQLIAAGQQSEGGDAMFDLRPAWMASPETVAQIFPRQVMFDVVIFDEASQCRLEEALPVLLRAKRVVVAGDPRQLPPSRFFESAVTASEDDGIESDQQLFESRQGEVEDLLCAALNLEIEEAYLDVHYRSRNADLIEFSNRYFYNSRLQAIPAHPNNRVRYAPVTLYHVSGVYDDRCNVAEAQRVAAIVHDLLRRATPPSIGIACFNLQQRDLILDKLDELAEQNAEFGHALSQARALRRGGHFEGLFVKNLENVQGDERDHIIISTTYGPDTQGRFYKRFGPLGRAGGGRRLNVLVTRAREEVHLVSSIPQSVYRNLPPVPPEQVPGGPWLLFAYLAYAEQLAEIYDHMHKTRPEAADVPPERRINESRFPSEFAKQLGQSLIEKHAIGSHVHWGNDGFCVDLALQHPHRVDDVTIGILCDLTRFSQAADPVEWEIFRTQILLSQGWKLHRLWTPGFFRDPEGQLDHILTLARNHIAAEGDKDAIATTA